MNSYSVTSIGVIIVTVLISHYISNKSKTYREIPYDQPIADGDFYGLTANPNWHKIDVGAFSLETPNAYLYTRLKGFDSKVGQFSNQVDTILFDYGWYSYNFREERNDEKFAINSMKINGRLFTIFRNETGTIGAYTEDLPNDYKLSIACDKCGSFEDIIEIVKTIKFKIDEH